MQILHTCMYMCIFIYLYTLIYTRVYKTHKHLCLLWGHLKFLAKKFQFIDPSLEAVRFKKNMITLLNYWLSVTVKKKIFFAQFHDKFKINFTFDMKVKVRFYRRQRKCLYVENFAAVQL